MDIHENGTRPTSAGPPEYFSGKVEIEPIISPDPPARIRAVSVIFQPGARTAWHTHPLGQTLVILRGQGRAQTRGGPVRVLNTGDTVWFAPGEEHWHGAAPDRAMCHLAMQEARDGSAVDWLEHVTDADYAQEAR